MCINKTNLVSKNQVNKFANARCTISGDKVTFTYRDIIDVMPNPLPRFELLDELKEKDILINANGFAISDTKYCFKRSKLESFIKAKRVQSFISDGYDFMTILKNFARNFKSDNPVACLSYCDLRRFYSKIDLAILLEILFALDVAEEYYEQTEKGFDLGFNVYIDILNDKLESLTNKSLSKKILG